MLTQKERQAIIQACKRQGACKPQFRRLIKTKTDKGFLNVLLDNIWWCNENAIPIPVHALKVWCSSKDELIVSDVSENPNMTPELLSELSERKSWRIRESVAEHPNTPKRVLEKLFNEKIIYHSYVLSKLAMNPYTHAPILKKLATRREWMIRRSVARNPNTPIRTLTDLSKDRDFEILCCIAKNPNTSKSVLRALLKKRNNLVRGSVMENPKYKEL